MGLNHRGDVIFRESIVAARCQKRENQCGSKGGAA